MGQKNSQFVFCYSALRSSCGSIEPGQFISREYKFSRSSLTIAPASGHIDPTMGGHKGFCLATMVDLLCCGLSGANWGPWAPPFALRQEVPARSVGKGIGHFFGAMKIEAFIDLDEFKSQIDDWIETFRQTKPQPGTPGVVIPGDPEREAEELRVKEGIPLIQPVIDELVDISKQTGIPFE